MLCTFTKGHRGALVGLLLCLCFSAVTLMAQVTTGTILGTVKDSTGAAIKDAQITVSSPSIGVTRTTQSASDGAFAVPNLPPATYSIVVEYQGFKKLSTDGVVLSAADKLNAGDLILQVGAATESVTVNADAAQLQLQSSSGERSDLISGKQLNDVALNGRMVLDYMKLIPGVVSQYDGSASGTGGLDQFNINGTRANEHEFTIDGSSNVDTGNNGGTHVTINPDAIAEVKVLTSNYQAEFGKAAGGQIAIVTKSGTNQFHGNVRFFHRNEGMNANNWFANQNDPPGLTAELDQEGYGGGAHGRRPGCLGSASLLQRRSRARRHCRGSRPVGRDHDWTAAEWSHQSGGRSQRLPLGRAWHRRTPHQ